ncbi:hypothetical protein [Marinivivus vitaminiproducens]|uniref:hypothetical protein n=1 Tax=Marinivivus vitaminiproducens TaxID=3035935 RepID=UPI0027A8A962|nr:hypothetical protein P4R82_11940 [Geminicoccaceae bacterium SCSIO 64248]
MRLLRCLALLPLLPLVMAVSLLEAWPQPTVGYRANMTIVSGSETLTGKVYAKPGWQRQEMPIHGMDTVAVLDFANGKVATWSPRMPVVMNMDLDAMLAASGDVRTLDYDHLTITPVGRETILGYETIKNEVHGRQDQGERFDGFVWLTETGNIPLRLTGTGSSPEKGTAEVEMTLTNVAIGDQPDALFRPPDSTALPVDRILEGLGGLLGNRN